MSVSERLPELLEEIAGRFGEGVMLRLAGDFGGTRIYVPAPKSIGPDHVLARSLGLAAARGVAERYGPGHVEIPLGPTASGPRCRRAALLALEENRSVREAARKAGMTERTIWRLKRRAKKRAGRGARQGDLFGDAGRKEPA